MSRAIPFTRREFLASTSLLLAGGTGLLYGRPVARLSADPIRVGLVGCGGRSTTAALQAISADPGVLIWAMGDLFADRLSGAYGRLASQLGDAGRDRLQVPADRRFLGFDAYQGVLASGVDSVILTAPPHFRPRHVAAAIDAGKHVFAETPLAIDAPGVRSILASIRAAETRRLAFQAGFCWRHADAERAAFARLREGVIGRVVTVHSTYYGHTLPTHPRRPEWSDAEWQYRNWLHFAWLSGDHVVEQAVHSIDRLHWAMDDGWGGRPARLPVRATALGGRAARRGPESGNIFDHFTVVYDYADGAQAIATCRQIDGCPRDNSDYIFGAAGSGIINGWGKVHAFRDERGGALWSFTPPPRPREMYQVAQDEFFASIRAGRPVNDGPRPAHTTLMAIMGRMAAYTGQTVTWDDALNSTDDFTPDTYTLGDLPVDPVPVPGAPRQP
jgi:predicted dehydrogenase